MTSRAVSRWLSRRLIRVAMRVAPREREDWAQAMSKEADAIPYDREALRWALGCLQATCRVRLRSMKLTSWRPVRWAMALWLALWALDALAYAGFTLDYKLGFSIEHYPYPPNVALLEVTPVWEPMLVGAAGVVLLLAVVLVLKRSRVAFGAVVAPIVLMLLLYAVRASRPESVILQSLSAAYEKSPLEMIWPIAGAAITMLICLALWQDRRALAPRHE